MPRKKVELRRTKKETLSKVQAEVKELLHGGYSPKLIARERNTSVQAVYKVINRLEEKGFWSKMYGWVEHDQSTIKPSEQKLRLHGQEFNIQILYKDSSYERKKKFGNFIHFEGNTVRLYRHSLEIYSKKDFYGDTVQEATSDSFEYWNRFFVKLENHLSVILLKPRKHNVKLVSHHYAEIGNELANDCEINDIKIKVFTSDDKKLWFQIDNSFELGEAETVHPETAKQDMEDSVRPFFNDLRDNRPPPVSQMYNLIYEQLRIGLLITRRKASLAQKKHRKRSSNKKQKFQGKPDYVG